MIPIPTHLAEGLTLFAMRQTFGDEVVRDQYEALPRDVQIEIAKRHSRQVASLIESRE